MDGAAERSGAAREEKRERWRAHLDGQASSGKSVGQYCAEHGLKSWQFWYWRRALKTTGRGFVELSAEGVRAASGVVLELGGCRLIVQAGFDAQLLRQVVAALRPA